MLIKNNFIVLLTTIMLSTNIAAVVAQNTNSKTSITAAPGVYEDRIVFGLEVSTGSASADEESYGWQIAFRQANDRGGVHGRQIEWLSYDRTRSDATQHLANAARMMDEGVFALVNFSGPGVVEIAELAKARRVPFFFPHSATVDSTSNRYLFTSFPRYPGEARLMYRYLAQDRGLNRLAIVHDENSYGQNFLNWLNDYAEPYGYTVVGSAAIDTRNPDDLTEELSALITSGAEGVIMALYVEQGVKLVQAKAALDWDGRLISVGPLTDETYLNIANGAAEGTLGFCYYPDPGLSQEPGVIAYRQAMQRYDPEHALNRYSLFGYVFANLLLEGLQQHGPNLSREGLIDTMETIRNWDSGGIMPPVTLTSEDHHAQKAGFICELKDGQFQALSDWIVP